MTAAAPLPAARGRWRGHAVLRVTLALAASLAAPVLAASEPAGEEPPAAETADLLSRTRISAVIFGDAYGFGDHHREEFDGASGFWIRRINLSFDHEVSDELSFRLRFEAASPGTPGDTTRLDPFVKDAFVRWRPGRHDWFFGLTGTPTWESAERFWGYRAVEKTVVDLHRKGSSRDLGVGFKGSFGAGGRLRVHAMLGNGADSRAVANSGKKSMLALGYQPSGPLFVELYGDVEDGDPGEPDRTTLQLLVAHQLPGRTLGLQLARQTTDGPGGAPRTDFDVLSVWGHLRLPGSRQMRLIARFDRTFDPNPAGEAIAYLPLDPTAETSFFLLGLDTNLHPQLTFIPNLELVEYDEAPGSPELPTELVARVTLSASF